MHPDLLLSSWRNCVSSQTNCPALPFRSSSGLAVRKPTSADLRCTFAGGGFDVPYGLLHNGTARRFPLPFDSAYARHSIAFGIAFTDNPALVVSRGKSSRIVHLVFQQTFERPLVGVRLDLAQLVVIVSIKGASLADDRVVLVAGHALDLLRVGEVVRQQAVPVVQQPELVRAAVAQLLGAPHEEVVQLLQPCESDESPA